MAELPRKVKKGEPNGAKDLKPGGEANSSAAGTKEPEGTSRRRAGRKDGAEELRQAADRQASLNADKLAGLLASKALEGDLASVKVLVSLADGKKPKEVKKRRGKSYALRLGAEPGWVDVPVGGAGADEAKGR
jgi:hypothetical protein